MQNDRDKTTFKGSTLREGALNRKKSALRLKNELLDRLYEHGISTGKLPGLPRSKSHSRFSSAARLPDIKPRQEESGTKLNQESFVGPGSMMTTLRDPSPDPRRSQSTHRRGKSVYNVYKTIDAQQLNLQESEEAKQRRQGVSTQLRSITGYTTMTALGPCKTHRNNREGHSLYRISQKYRYKRLNDSSVTTQRIRGPGPEMNSFAQPSMNIGMDAQAVEDFIHSQDLVARMSGKQTVSLAQFISDQHQKSNNTPLSHKISIPGVPPKSEEPQVLTIEHWIKKIQDEAKKEEGKGAFVYLKSVDKRNPYNLVYCSYAETEDNKGRYYTLSQKGFTLYNNNVADEFIPIVDWLLERELFSQVHSLKLFKMFKVWRLMKFWRHNVIDERRRIIKQHLEKKMIITRPGFIQIILQHQANCQQIERCSLVDISETDHPLTLRQFESVQESHHENMVHKITELSRFTQQNLVQLMEVRLENLKTKINECKKEANKAQDFQSGNNEEAGDIPNLLAKQIIEEQKKNTLVSKTEIDSIYERLGFGPDLSYAHRSEIRKLCKRYLRFTVLLDFIAKTSLSNLYSKSIMRLDRHLSQKSQISLPPELPLLQNSSEYVPDDMNHPILQIAAYLDESFLPEEKISYELIDGYEPSPIGKIDESNFDPSCHLEIQKDVPINIMERKIPHLVANGLYSCWIRIKPNLVDVEEILKKSFDSMYVALKQYNRHSKIRSLKPFERIVNEWEDKPDNHYDPDPSLNCEAILTECDVFSLKDKILEKHMVQFEKTFDTYIRLFEPYFVKYWQYQRINWDIIKEDQLRYPTDILKLLFTQLTSAKNNLPYRIPTSADLGFFKLSLHAVRDKLLKYPVTCLKKLDEIMPFYISVECENIKQWLEKWESKISTEADTASKYVEQLNAITFVEENISSCILKMETTREIMNICNYYHVKSTKEELYNELTQLIKEINFALAQGKELGDKKKPLFKIEHKKKVKQVRRETELLDREVNDPYFMNYTIYVDEIMERLGQLKKNCENIKEAAKQCNSIEQMLEIEVNNFECVEEVEADIEVRQELWSSLKSFKAYVARWRSGEFNSINTVDILNTAEHFSKIILRCENRGMKDATAVLELKQDVSVFKETIPVVEALCNRKLKEVHWAEIKTLINTDKKLEARNFTLDDLIQLGVGKYRDEIHNISLTASQEHILKQQLNTIKTQWNKRGFVLKEYNREIKRDVVNIISECDLLYIDLEEAITNINTISGSRYAKRISEKVAAVKAQFDLMWLVVDEWIHCQRNWLYLDSIFSSVDIRVNLKKETADFEIVDKLWKDMMRILSVHSKNVILLYVTQERLEKLQKLNKSMNRIKKELKQYLETKRKEFPRFYFLSDGELLPVMARATNIQSAEPILPKCFDGITKLEVVGVKPLSEITGIFSSEGEKLTIKTIRMHSDENIVMWLKGVEINTFDLLRKSIKRGYLDYFQGEENRKLWVLQHSSQVVSCVSQLIWTESCEYSIKEFNEDDSALIDLYQQATTQINQLLEGIHDEMTPIQRNVFISLLTKDVHWRDIIEKLAFVEVSSLNDFDWQAQLRYYFVQKGETEEVQVHQINAELSYGYEYIGTPSHLVITPLTERCFITITSALRIQRGASPAGPAGTGKTETVKHLAKLVATQCVVFNCSDQLDIKIINRLFSGLILQGAWACLDEFNRIDIEVLSVIAQQLLQISDTLRSGKPEIYFNEIEMKIKPSIGVMVTMNPDYAGRTELPDNLKMLFRPVTMIIPDYSLIGEILLFAHGFKEAKKLSAKISQLYRLASEQLSQQSHYDFGMRAIKSALILAGEYKAREPSTSEELLLFKAVKDANIPKFINEDLILFDQLLKDLFPGLETAETSHDKLQHEIESFMKTKSLKPGNIFIQKVLQLFESLNVRYGVMLIGKPGVGKTTCFKTLCASLNSLFQTEDSEKIDTYSIFPNALTLGELYGEESTDTKEWRYGVVSKILKTASGQSRSKLISEKAKPNHTKSWIIFDGPIDSQWVENMNSVLDDSRILCLANAERIKISESIRFLFEVENLSTASLATVSRCGMVYFSETDVGWQAFIQSWSENIFTNQQLFKYNEDVKIYMKMLMEESLDRCASSLEKLQSKYMVPVSLIQLLKTFTVMMEHWFSQIASSETLDNKKRKLLGYFTYSLAWSFGGLLNQSGRQDIDDLVRLLVPKCNVPYSGTLFDYCFSGVEGSCLNWTNWREMVPTFECRFPCAFSSLFVPTADSVKYSFLVQIFLQNFSSSLIIGDTGVGKSMIIQYILNEQTNPEKLCIYSLVYSSSTSPSETQQILETQMEPKRGKIVIGPPGQKKACLFVDDLNMPQRLASGAQPPLELLRQLLQFKGFYGKAKMAFTEVQDLMMLCVASSSSRGSNGMAPRFAHLFNSFYIPNPTSETLKGIFEKILGQFLQSQNFPSSVVKLSSVVVGSTIDLYQNICTVLKPIPAKFHYVYNLRDLSRVFQTMLQGTPKSINSPDVFARLWLHECMRVFGDRLSCETDTRWLQDYIVTLINSRFRHGWTWEEIFYKRKIIFTDLHRREFEVEDRAFEEIKDIKLLSKLFDEILWEYNQKNINNKMELVFFDDAVGYILAISRSLRQKRGNCLLIGVSGCGKESYTSFSSFMLDSICLQIKLSKSYRRENFKEDLKGIMRVAGLDGRSITLMMSEQQFSNEKLLEDVNRLLNTGEINNLYRPEEIEAIYKDITPIMQALKRVETREKKHATFIERVRENLHIVMCMSPIGDAFRIRCRKYPSLINCSTLIYFNKWPQQALESVCSKIISEIGYVDKELLKGLTQIFPKVHLSVEEMCETFNQELKRKFYVTPKSFIDAINFFAKLWQSMMENYRNNVGRLGKGLRNFQTASKMVSQLQGTLTRLHPQIEENNRRTTKALEFKEIEGKKVAEEEEKIEHQNNILYQQKTIIEISRAEAQKELEKVQPILDEALVGLETINPKDIANIRSYPRPPKMVLSVMEAVMTLLNNDTVELKATWEAAKELLIEKGFIKKLKDLQFKKLTANTIKNLRHYTATFDPKEIAQIDSASVSLANWCVAIEKCYEAYLKVAPQEAKLKKIENDYKAKQKEVAIMAKTLEAVKVTLKQFELEHKKLSEEAKTISDTLERTKYQLENAEKLTKLLFSEGERWNLIITKLKEEDKEIIGNAFLSAVSISYIGPFTTQFRERLIEEWKLMCLSWRIPISNEFSIIQILGTPIELKQWNLQGLPQDRKSMENGLLAKKSNRWPLMIDPEGQANKWIRNMESSNELIIVKYSTDDYHREFEKAIQLGKPLLLEDIQEELDYSLYQVLAKKTYRSEVGERIFFVNKELPYDPRFRLYVTTKHVNPHYMPEICNILNIVNFSVTFEAMEEQLLVEVILKERPEIEESRIKLLTEIAHYQFQLREYEETILEKLTNTSEETILMDLELVDSLKKTKKNTEEIAKSISEAELTEAALNKARDQYRRVATRGAVMYFTLVDISKINNMYQFSFNFLKKLFIRGLELSAKGETEKINNMIQSITEVVYRNTCIGLFDEHKLVFSLLIPTYISLQEGTITSKHLNLFIQGAQTSLSGDSKPPQMLKLSEKSWNLAQLAEAELTSFKGLIESLKGREKNWLDFIKAENPFQARNLISLSTSHSMDAFDILILVRILTPHKVRQACLQYVVDKLGTIFINFNKPSMETIFADSNNTTPIVFILSPGTDPTDEIKQYRDLMIISLGKEQEFRAESELKESKKTGRWLLLQNCHLARSFMPRLENLTLNFEKEEIHPKFRLLLTSMPVDYFPPTILQNRLKLTTEDPSGVEARAQQAFNHIQEESRERWGAKRKEWRKMIQGLSIFHAVVKERGKFGSIGWSNRYEFNMTDFDTSLAMLQDFFGKQDKIAWGALSYLIGQINYGGRVTDEWDRKVLICTLNRFINSKELSSEDDREGLPDLPNETDLFGLPENSTLAYENRSSENLLSSLLFIQPQIKNKSSGDSNHNKLQQTIKQMLETVPFQIEEDKYKPVKEEIINSMATVLRQEIQKYNSLIFLVQNDLINLEQAIKGEIVMSEELEIIMKSLLIAKVPQTWKLYDSMKSLFSWFKDFSERVDFFRKWNMEGLPSVFKLSSFMHPQGFLTGVLQAHARKEGIPFDSLGFEFEFLTTSEIDNLSTSKGTYIHSLYIESAGWNLSKARLCDLPKTELTMRMPYIKLPVAEER